MSGRIPGSSPYPSQYAHYAANSASSSSRTGNTASNSLANPASQSRTGNLPASANPSYGNNPPPALPRSGHASAMRPEIHYGNYLQHSLSHPGASAKQAGASGSIASVSSERVLQPVFRKLNFNFRQDAMKYKEFLMELDQDSYEKRFSDLPREENLPEYFTDGVCIGVFDKNKLVGFADYMEDDDSPEKCAIVNMVVKGSAQGQGLGKKLMEIRDQCLIEDGYKYKSGNVYPSNTKQIERLIRNGWKVTEHDEDFVHLMKRVR